MRPLVVAVLAALVIVHGFRHTRDALEMAEEKLAVHMEAGHQVRQSGNDTNDGVPSTTMVPLSELQVDDAEEDGYVASDSDAEEDGHAASKRRKILRAKAAAAEARKEAAEAAAVALAKQKAFQRAKKYADLKDTEAKAAAAAAQMLREDWEELQSSHSMIQKKVGGKAKGLDIPIYATGDWRDVPGAVEALFDVIQPMGYSYAITKFTQEMEGKSEAASAMGMLRHYESVGQLDFDPNSKILFIGTGKGSTQWVLYEGGGFSKWLGTTRLDNHDPNIDSPEVQARQADGGGYPKKGDPHESVLDAFRRIYQSLALDENPAVIIAWGSVYYNAQKKGCLVIPDKDPFPAAITTYTDHFVAKLSWAPPEAAVSRTKMVVLRSIRLPPSPSLPDGGMWKVNWVNDQGISTLSKDGYYIDLGSGKAARVKGDGSGEQEVNTEEIGKKGTTTEGMEPPAVGVEHIASTSVAIGVCSDLTFKTGIKK